MGFEGNVSHVSEDPRVEFYWIEGFGVVFKGDLIVTSGDKIAKNLIGQFLLGHLFVVLDFANKHYYLQVNLLVYSQKILLLLLLWSPKEIKLLRSPEGIKLITAKFVIRKNIILNFLYYLLRKGHFLRMSRVLEVANYKVEEVPKDFEQVIKSFIFMRRHKQISVQRPLLDFNATDK